MKDRKKRCVFSLVVFCFWSTIFLLFVSSFTFATLRLFFEGEDYRPRLISQSKLPVMDLMSGENPDSPVIRIRETVIFPDQALVFLKYLPNIIVAKEDITCIYLDLNSLQPKLQLSPVSIDGGYGDLQIVRCPLHPLGTTISLDVSHHGNLKPGPVYRWDSLSYEAIIDSDNSTVVFVKGLNLRSGRASNPSKFKCVYGWDMLKSNLVLSVDTISAAQEVVRCKTPLSVLNSLRRFSSSNSDDSMKVSVMAVGRQTLSSVARLNHQLKSTPQSQDKQHRMCVCTMLRNQAGALREWIMYHERIGVSRWFLYDNNSEDDLEHAMESLVDANYNLTRHVWPWIKTQEAGFSHCALKARDSCEWVGFIDVDEFLHLPSNLSLHHIINNHSVYNNVAELRVPCHSFGPSGLKKLPTRGVIDGYTCRLAAPERHKSIVKPEALSSSLMNLVHHFHLKPGLTHVNINRNELVINHYKYQVWQVFKEKFYRRVATFVSDWQQDRNVGSKDRAPGLGTKPVEPLDWSSRFCEVHDSGLRDHILEKFTDQKTSLLPWEYPLNEHQK